jgi:hypothetical protein
MDASSGVYSGMVIINLDTIVFISVGCDTNVISAPIIF